MLSGNDARFLDGTCAESTSAADPNPRLLGGRSSATARALLYILPQMALENESDSRSFQGLIPVVGPRT